MVKHFSHKETIVGSTPTPTTSSVNTVGKLIEKRLTNSLSPFNTIMINTNEYKQGELAHSQGKTTRDNPYPIMSEQAWRWQEGYFGNGRKLDNDERLHRTT